MYLGMKSLIIHMTFWVPDNVIINKSSEVTSASNTYEERMSFDTGLWDNDLGDCYKKSSDKRQL